MKFSLPKLKISGLSGFNPETFKKAIEFIKSHYRQILVCLSVFLLIFSLGAGFGHFVFNKAEKNMVPTDPYLAFIGEVYDKIKTNYWQEITDEGLSNIFELGAQKISAKPQMVLTKDRPGVEKMVGGIIKNKPEAEKKDFVVSLANIVLVNLSPFGRSQLYLAKNEEALQNTLQNIDAGADLYSVLGAQKSDSPQQIETAYERKLLQLEAEKGQPDYFEKVSQLERAKDALANEAAKSRYDATKAEPTVVGELIGDSILHLRIKKISPSALDELKQVSDSFDKGENLYSLVLDLRGNIGGSIDILPYLLGPFIGPNQYGFEFVHQENYTPFKTVFGWLPGLIRYKRVAVLIDEKMQSSAEVMAAALKKYNVGILVGVRTQGWGTVEKVFPIENQIDDKEVYSLFLVHSLVIGEDGQPIEGNGISPAVDIGDENWQEQLMLYFNDRNFINVIASLFE